MARSPTGSAGARSTSSAWCSPPAFAFPLFLLVDTGEPVVIWLALVVAIALGLGADDRRAARLLRRLFGARVRYTRFAASREVGAASPVLPAGRACAADAGGGDSRGWSRCSWSCSALISLVAFLAAPEVKDRDMDEMGPAPSPPSRRRDGPVTDGGSLPRPERSAMVHLGAGAFLRAHTAVLTEDASRPSPGGWGLRRRALLARVVDALRAPGRAVRAARAGRVGTHGPGRRAVREVLVGADDPECCASASPTPRSGW